MTSVVVQRSHGGSWDRRWSLRDGDVLTFGGDPGTVDLAFPDANLPARLGRVLVGEACWWVENDSAATRIVVENDGGHDFVKVAPGSRLPVPFTSSRVLLLAERGMHSFAALTDGYAGAGLGAAPDVEDNSRLLNEGAKYFRVLVALCEPALTTGSTAVIPSSTEIAHRLRRVWPCQNLTATAVQFHLNYLLTSKLRAHVASYAAIAGAGESDQPYLNRGLLVDLALRFDLVSRRHLALIEPTVRLPRR